MTSLWLDRADPIADDPLPSGDVKLDAVVVVEPAEIVGSEEHGLRALYVALTRSTQRLSVVHCQELPDAML